MLKYIPYAIQALFVLGGVTLGLWLKAAPQASDAAMIIDQAGAHEPAPGESLEKESDKQSTTRNKKEKKKKAKKKKNNHHGDSKESSSQGSGGGHGGDTTVSEGYMKFSRQFVVPVIERDGVQSLIVMDINLEVPEAAAESIYAREPKIRDSLLSTLLRLSNEGAFKANLLEKSNLDRIRSDLLQSARTIIGEDAENVLILNITRQDV